MKIKKWAIFSVFVCIFCLTVTNVLAASPEKASIIGDEVRLNETLVNNINSDYPLLKYKNITYFPLTWDYCRFLGLDIIWGKDVGLIINQSDSFDYKVSEETNTINQLNAQLPVVIPQYTITINGAKIVHEKEKWPFINYKGITYFPLTWRFAVDMFGWDYSWSKEKGLVILCPGGKPAYNENLLSIINKTTIGQGYSFEANIIIDQRSNEKITDFLGKPSIAK